MSEKRTVARAAGLVASVTLGSRILGMVRDVVLAHLFGATPAADAFWVALRIPNTLRRLFGEGTLTPSTVPVLREARIVHGDARALRIAQVTWTLVLVVLVAVAALGSRGAGIFIHVLAPGFGDDPERLHLAIELLRITFPYIALIGLVGLAQGILNAFDHFFAPAFHPILYNLVMIAGAFSLVHVIDPPIAGMAWSVIVAGGAQLVLHVPFLKAKGLSLVPALDLADPGMRRILSLMGPAVFGVAIYQANIFVGTILASWLEQGSISWLFYADRLFQLPLGVFVIALGSALLPTLSSQATEGRIDDLRSTVGAALRVVMLLTVPAAAALTVLALPIVAVLFQRGAFDPDDTVRTAAALVMYALGLVPIAAGRILVQVFYSFQNTRTPVRIAAIAFAVNLVASLALMGPLGHRGLALATSISAWCQLGLTYGALRISYLPALGLARLVLDLVKSTLLVLPMVAWTLWVRPRVDWLEVGLAWRSLAWIVAAVVGGLGIYGATLTVLRVPEARLGLRLVTRRLRRAGDVDR